MSILLSPCTNGAPKNKEAAIIKGIKGGRLTLEATKANTLFNLKRTDKLMTSKVWNPQKGERPIKTPRAMEKAFVRLLPSLSSTSSFKNLLKLFFFEIIHKVSRNNIKQSNRYQNSIQNTDPCKILERSEMRNPLRRII